MAKTKTKPIEVKVGNVVVNIYRRKRVRGEKTYPVFDVADYSEGKRKFLSFAGEQEARDKASQIAVLLANRQGAVLSVTNTDWAAYVRALELLKPTGVPLELAAAQFAEVHAMLGGRSLKEAVSYFVKRQPAAVPQKTVREVYDEMLRMKAKDGSSPVYLKDLKYRVGAFVKHFGGQIAEVSEGQLNEWLRSLPGCARSRNNVRDAVRAMFRYAVDAMYLPKDHLDFGKVVKVRCVAGDVEIFTAEELVKCLNAAAGSEMKRSLVPLLALGAFAGLRTAEIERQVWADVMLDRGYIRVTGAKGNTAQKRLVPITPNLAKWLAGYWRKDARVWDYGRTADAIGRLAEKAGLDWKHNALRHSYGSYRLALVQDPAKVAYEMGNSAGMVVRHYREVVLPEEATTWFSIEPAADGKIIVLQAAKKEDSVAAAGAGAPTAKMAVG